MPHGYHGKILVVDLTAQTWKDVTLLDEIYRKYFGGYGLGAYYIYTHILYETFFTGRVSSHECI